MKGLQLFQFLIKFENYLFLKLNCKMIEYYRVPQKKGFNKDDVLFITEQYELKDAIHNGKILKAKKLEMKNSNINDDTIGLLWTVSSQFNLTSINIAQNFSFITDKSIQNLCQCINLRTLTSLNLSDDSITDDGLLKLSKCQVVANLQELILYGNSDITSQSLIYFAESQWLKKIKKLDLHATSIDDQGLSLFVQSQNSSSLQELNVSMNWKRITDKSIVSIAKSKTCSKLTVLNFEDCAITDVSFQYLAESQNASNIHTLILNNSIKQRNNIITDESFQYLAYSKHMRRIKNLQLRNTDVSSKGIRTFASSLAVESLQILRLSYCKNIDQEVIICLKSIMQYRSLKKVYLNNTKVSKQACQQLQKQYEQINIIF